MDTWIITAALSFWRATCSESSRNPGSTSRNHRLKSLTAILFSSTQLPPVSSLENRDPATCESLQVQTFEDSPSKLSDVDELRGTRNVKYQGK
ncbi:hypothetical protein BDP27DRAFT_1313027 [Rhodocollybia butyracea]|uniref:Uncharacterized protein n=1 Tax=Rhodocollybia butyracea TaxID=206335 RepID=A0A9P5UF92_9AGAR|nr:hypothetical protein BDP27DRAFT_1345021 [Rhodocollybia butyracea]KAF9077044.1 hypothetical protein BDP27DRAFT_1313027 [Rhodocollybia butyracea]